MNIFANLTGQIAARLLDENFAELGARIDDIGQGGTGGTGGAALGLKYALDGDTGDADPGVGKFRFDNATQANATTLFISATDANGVSVAPLLRLLGEGARLRVQSAAAATQHHELLVLGTVQAGAGAYYKVRYARAYSGTVAIANGSTVQITDAAIAAEYSGGVPGDITALSRNTDGSIASVTIGGLAWQQAYGTSGARTTETLDLTPTDLVRTHNRDANGVFTGVSGALFVGGVLNVTWALAKTMTPATGMRIRITDVGDMGVDTVWTGSRWAPAGGRQALRARGQAYSITGTTAVTAFGTPALTIPGGLIGPNHGVRGWLKGGGNDATDSKTLFVRIGSTDLIAIPSLTSMGMAFEREIWNQNAVNTQTLNTNDSSSATQFSAANDTATIDFTADQTVLYRGQLAVAGDTVSIFAHGLDWIGTT